jgi:hypothetical protein
MMYSTDMITHHFTVGEYKLWLRLIDITRRYQVDETTLFNNLEETFRNNYEYKDKGLDI